MSPPDAGDNPPTPADQLRRRLTDFTRAEHILVALDFDGVLAPLIEDPTQSRPILEAALALQRLARAPGVQLALVSRRPAPGLGALADRPPSTWRVASDGQPAAVV